MLGLMFDKLWLQSLASRRRRDTDAAARHDRMQVSSIGRTGSSRRVRRRRAYPLPAAAARALAPSPSSRPSAPPPPAPTPPAADTHAGSAYARTKWSPRILRRPRRAAPAPRPRAAPAPRLAPRPRPRASARAPPRAHTRTHARAHAQQPTNCAGDRAQVFISLIACGIYIYGTYVGCTSGGTASAAAPSARSTPLTDGFHGAPFLRRSWRPIATARLAGVRHCTGRLFVLDYFLRWFACPIAYATLFGFEPLVDLATIHRPVIDIVEMMRKPPAEEGRRRRPMAAEGRPPAASCACCASSASFARSSCSSNITALNRRRWRLCSPWFPSSSSSPAS